MSGGLQKKYNVTRVDDPTGKHDECRYFVLDPQHDPIARHVLDIYRWFAEDEYPELAADLDAWLKGTPDE